MVSARNSYYTRAIESNLAYSMLCRFADAFYALKHDSVIVSDAYAWSRMLEQLIPATSNETRPWRS